MTETDHLLFSAGGLLLATDSSSVHCIHESLVAAREDGTCDWFLGLAVADERLLPITDLGDYLDGEKSSGRVLEVARQFGIAGLKIDEVHGVSQAQPDNVESAGVPSQQDTPLLNKVINEQERQYQLVDMGKLMQSNRFLNVALEPA